MRLKVLHKILIIEKNKLIELVENLIQYLVVNMYYFRCSKKDNFKSK